MAEKALIRAFEEADRERIREIFCQSGQRGNPLRVYIEDKELVLRLLADYYMDHEPEWCFVAEVDKKVVGYILGCRDTKRYMRVVVTRILPRLILRVLWKIVTFQYRERKTYDTIWWFMARAWRELPRFPLKRYPAHAHLHIEAESRHLHLGPRLVDTLADRLRESGVPGLHGIALEEAGKNAMGTALRMNVLAVRRTTVWDRCTGKRWEAKLLVRDL